MRKQQERHGHTAKGALSPTYRSWVSMKARCLDQNHHAYSRYGGAGVKVCERWLMFGNFLADMGERPEGTSLGRLGDVGNYEPSNCQWQTDKEQAKRGEHQNKAKLTEEQVLCIRALHTPFRQGKVHAHNIAADLVMDASTIYRVLQRKTWSHI